MKLIDHSSALRALGSFVRMPQLSLSISMNVAARFLVVTLFVLFLFPAWSLAQAGTGSLHGSVTDPSGAIVPGATVAASSASGQTASGKTDAQGGYRIQGLAPGTYSVNVTAKGFAPFSQADVAVAAGQALKFDAALEIAVQQQELDVQAQGTAVSVDPENNANTVVLKGKDLDALSDDPDDLQSELQALAGPAAGPNGGQIYIDGFTGGALPPKASIREIRVNSNPFSAEYDKLGYGRIEILTKPGTDRLHGQLMFNDNDALFNSKNAFYPINEPDPSYNTQQIEGGIGGSLSKKASFNFNVERRNIHDVALITPGCSGNSTLQQCNSGILATPRTRTEISPRLDYQITPTNTLVARYQYESSSDKNNGVGQFSLASQAFNENSSEQTVQISDTQVLSARMVNEARLQFQSTRDNSRALNSTPRLVVPGTFTAGGNSSGNSVDDETHYEFQNFVSIVAGTHTMKFGGRFRALNASQISSSNFNGTFTFASLADYLNGVPEQFSINTGQQGVRDLYVDTGIYAQDDWRVRPNMTLSYGLRYEVQNNLDEHHDFAPRASFAWGIGRSKSAPKTVLRTGVGIFYDRFGQNLAIQDARFAPGATNSYSTKTAALLAGYPTVPPTSLLQADPTNNSIYTVNPNLRSPYIMQEAVGIERQLTKNSTLAVTYLHSRGVHQFFTDNINAGGLGQGINNQYVSEGIFKQTQLITNFNMRAGTKLFLFGFYTLNFANSDTAGANSYPMNQQDASADFGPTSFDIRHRLFFGGSVLVPYGFRLSPFLIASSGQPYNITIGGKDFGNSSIFNARPALVTDPALCPSLSPTKASCFTTTVPGSVADAIPPYYGIGPKFFSLNLRVAKTIGVGPKREAAASTSGGGGGGGRGGGGGDRGGFGGFGGMGGGGIRGAMGGGGASDRRYSLTFSVSGRNIFNNVNPATPGSVVTSGKFGLFISQASNFGPGGSSQAANRRIDLQVSFAF